MPSLIIRKTEVWSVSDSMKMDSLLPRVHDPYSDSVIVVFRILRMGSLQAVDGILSITITGRFFRYSGNLSSCLVHCS